MFTVLVPRSFEPLPTYFIFKPLATHHATVCSCSCSEDGSLQGRIYEGVRSFCFGRPVSAFIFDKFVYQRRTDGGFVTMVDNVELARSWRRRGSQGRGARWGDGMVEKSIKVLTFWTICSFLSDSFSDLFLPTINPHPFPALTPP